MPNILYHDKIEWNNFLSSKPTYFLTMDSSRKYYISAEQLLKNCGFSASKFDGDANSSYTLQKYIFHLTVVTYTDCLDLYWLYWLVLIVLTNTLKFSAESNITTEPVRGNYVCVEICAYNLPVAPRVIFQGSLTFYLS